MAKNNLLDTRTTSFSELFSNGRIYKVPIYQRDYSWGKDNWEDLWMDIISSYRNDESHYMGAIVLKGAGDDSVLTVIDGQQRLATLSILAIAIIDKIKELEERDIEPNGNRERQLILRRTYLGDKSPRSLKYSSKLFLNQNNDSFYQSHLVNFREPKRLRALSDSNRLLWEAFLYFKGQIGELSEITEEGGLLADFLTQVVARRLLFIQINVEDDVNAYVVFETLNSRGVELSATDLLKNYLFSQFEDESDLEAAQRDWSAITRTVGMKKFPEFLKYFLSMTKSRVRNNQLFKLTKNKVRTPQEAFNLLEDLEDLSDLYVALGNPNDSFWLDFSNSKAVISLVTELNLFRTKQAYPALFAAHNHFSESDFEKMLRIVAVLSFRYTVVSGLNPNDLEKQYNTLASLISQESIKTPKGAFNLISSALYVEDEKFIQDFSLLTIDNKQKKQLTKYILKQLEKDCTGINITEDSFSIEHILPQNPDDSWREDFKDNEIDSAIYRLGNMTPIEPSLNATIGREPYEEKKKAYQKSKYKLTTDIEAEEWTIASIISRQRRMAERAAHIWRID